MIFGPGYLQAPGLTVRETTVMLVYTLLLILNTIVPYFIQDSQNLQLSIAGVLFCNIFGTTVLARISMDEIEKGLKSDNTGSVQ